MLLGLQLSVRTICARPKRPRASPSSRWFGTPAGRNWATERKELPLKDVAAAGGWKDVTTLLTCYQHADETICWG
jgi:hypothetical protein